MFAKRRAWGIVSCFFRHIPGRIQEEFAVELPRPRDINSVDLAAYATRITKALKSLGKTATG